MGRPTVKAMQANEAAYVESIGKIDRQGVMNALEEEGHGTALRICYGATAEEMPIRALSYAAAAIEIQERYFPYAQLQIVHPLTAGEAINGVPKDESIPRAQALHEGLARLLGDRMAHANVALLLDQAPPDADTVERTRAVLAARPDVSRPFESASAKHGGDYAAYVAAHALMHDTDPVLLPLGEASDDALPVERIISVGAQSERSFYLARMACKEAAAMSTQVETGQIFTKHVLPPYFECREGEPLLSDGLELLDQTVAEHPVPSVRRDLVFLQGLANNSVGARE